MTQSLRQRFKAITRSERSLSPILPLRRRRVQSSSQVVAATDYR